MGINDSDNQSKRLKKPIENHKTAAWANIEADKRDSNVAKPSSAQSRNAKEYVDRNEK